MKTRLPTATGVLLVLLSAILIADVSSAQSLSGEPPWLIEQSKTFSALKKRVPRSVAQDLLWTETTTEIPHLINVLWLKSNGEDLLVASVVSESTAPDWRIFSHSGKLVGLLSLSITTTYCISDLRQDGVLSIFGAGMQIGVVSVESRNATQSFEPTTGRINRKSEHFRVIDIGKSGLSINTNPKVDSVARHEMTIGCQNKLIWNEVN